MAQRRKLPSRRESPLQAYVRPDIKSRAVRVAQSSDKSVSRLIEECLASALPELEKAAGIKS
jgi:hypothetical protein